MPQKPKKKPHEMTNHEAMEHLFTPEGAEHIKRVVREHDEAQDSEAESPDDEEPGARATE